MQSDERLCVGYQRNGLYMYGAISLHSGTEAQPEWSYPFVVSKRVEGGDTIYGSVINLIDETAKPILRLNRRLRALAESLPEEVRSTASVSQTDKATIYEMREAGFGASLVHQADELTKDALLLSGLHVRTLLEIFSGKGNIQVGVYDYDSNEIGTVSLTQLFNTLMHYRYCVVSGGYIRDIFSGDRQVESQRLTGSKIDTVELFEAILDYVSGIRVNDFVGMLRGRLEGLNVHSEPRDIMFAVQNVHSLEQVIGDRITDERFPDMMQLLFKELTGDDTCVIGSSKGQSRVTLVGRFAKPHFKIGAELQEKRIEMSIEMDETSQEFTFDRDEFLQALTDVYGDEPLTPLEKLVDRHGGLEL